VHRQRTATNDRFLNGLLGPWSLLFKAVSFINLGLRGWHPRRFPQEYIISVDSLSFGGTGKTPLVVALGQFLRQRRLRFAIVTRGYRSRLEKQGALVSATHRLNDVGDEALIFRHFFPDQDIFVGRDRRRSVELAIGRGNRFIILDDGFQTTQLVKDWRLMLVNPDHPYYFLRHFRFLTHRSDRQLYFHRRPGRKADVAKTYDFRIEGFFDAAQRRRRPGSSGLFAFSALGDNRRFQRDLVQYRLLGFKAFADHHRYTQAELTELNESRLRAGADWLVCTLKDFVKITDLDLKGLPLLYVRNAIQLDGEIVKEIIDDAAKKGFVRL